MIRVPLVRPSLGEAEALAAARVVRSGWLTQGREVAAFEEEFALAVGARFAVAVSNGTTALELALRALGIGPGADVLTVSHSFIATTNAIVGVGARPVFVDIESETLGLDASLLESALTEATAAILCVHQLGMPCAIGGILRFAEPRNLPVIEDAACAVGSQILTGGEWQRIGRPHGNIACFSFHPRKVVTTGEGGMLTTADASIARRLRLLRQHGMSISDLERHAAGGRVVEEYLEPGFNARLTDMQAAIGRPQIARLDEIIRERRRIASFYGERLAGHSVLEAPEEPSWARCNWQSFPVRLREGSRLSRTEVIEHFLGLGIACKPGVTNAHEEPAYRSSGSWACGPEACLNRCRPGTCRRLTQSETLRDRTILLPLFHGMTEEELTLVDSACAALSDL